MHATLAIAATHERLLRAPQPTRRTIREDFHWTQCVALFNQKLSQPIRAQDRDPLWAAAATLGVLSFSSVEATTPEDAWPLNDAVSSKLEWLDISRGKMAVWNLVDPLRPGSIFNVLKDEYVNLFRPLPSISVDTIPIELRRLCDLDNSSTSDNNMYFIAVQGLVQLLGSSADQKNLATILAFVGHMQESFKSLLVKRDAIALLLLALWFSHIRGTVWWLEQRATIEGQAICIYLQKYHRDNELVQQLLPPSL